MQNDFLWCRMSRPINQAGNLCPPCKVKGTFKLFLLTAEGKQGVNLAEGDFHPATFENTLAVWRTMFLLTPTASPQHRTRCILFSRYRNKGVNCHSTLFFPTSVSSLTKTQASDMQKLDVFTTGSFLATCNRHTILTFTVFNEYICFAKEVELQSESRSRWLMMPL